MAWELDPILLDTYVADLENLAVPEELRGLKPAYATNAQLDAHTSAWARAYRVKRPTGSYACLRFWTAEPAQSLLDTYEAWGRTNGGPVVAILPSTRLFSQAIRVHGRAIPAVLMEWVDGHSLANLVTMHLNAPQELVCIAEELLRTFVLLNGADTSHGDLRASNILMSRGSGAWRVRLIDLDSLRWREGPSSARIVGGNADFSVLRARERVTPLESDYLDQALTYLAVVSVATDKQRWPGNTDGFLTLEFLNGGQDTLLSELEMMSGTPSRIAKVVRRVLTGQGRWHDLARAMSGASTLTESEVRSQPMLTREEFGRRMLELAASAQNRSAAPTPKGYSESHIRSVGASPSGVADEKNIKARPRSIENHPSSESRKVIRAENLTPLEVVAILLQLVPHWMWFVLVCSVFALGFFGLI